MTDLTVSLRLLLESRGLTRNLNGANGDLNRFGNNGRRAMSQLDSSIRTVRNSLAGLGIGLAAGRAIRDSARLDKQLTQIGQTAGANTSQVKGLRDEIFKMARDTGRPIDTLVGGFNNLIQSGLDFKAALEATRAINPASAVTGAGEDVLAGGLSVAAAAFEFDLSKPRLAVDLLDQMVVAGRLGNAELENLADIFARVGVNAKAANLTFPQTLAFVEGLSQVERQPERLATLADSTLRLFNNQKYQDAATEATGVSFYSADGSSREPFKVLADIAGEYRKLATDQARDSFISEAFGKADIDTQKGLRTLLAGDALRQIDDYTAKIGKAGGTVQRDLTSAIDNAVDQSARLGSSLREAGEAFAKPINRALSDLIEYQLDSPEKGGLGLSSGETALTTGALIVGVGALTGLARSLLNRIPIIGGAAGDAAALAGGVAQGKALEKLAGVTPVFVTNFPDCCECDKLGGVAETALATAAGTAAIGGLAKAGLLATAGTGALALGVAGGASYATGRKFYADKLEGTQAGDQVGRAIAVLLAALGSKEARAALDARNREPTIAPPPIDGTIRIQIDNLGRPQVLQATGRGVNLDVDLRRGPLLPGLLQ